jgi:hypothetical protein
VSEKKRNEKNKLTKYFFRAVTKSFSLFLFPSNFTLAGGVVAVVAAVVDDACVGCRSRVPSD